MFRVSEISVTYKPHFKASERPKINDSRDAEKILRQEWSDRINYCEEFAILLLNRANSVLGICKISSGGIAGTVADPKMIFQVALKANATSIILAHNHPSGNLKPSSADIMLTQKLKTAGGYLDLSVLDHLILTEEAFYSFADDGIL